MVLSETILKFNRKLSFEPDPPIREVAEVGGPHRTASYWETARVEEQNGTFFPFLIPVLIRDTPPREVNYF